MEPLEVTLHKATVFVLPVSLRRYWMKGSDPLIAWSALKSQFLTLCQQHQAWPYIFAHISNMGLWYAMD